MKTMLTCIVSAFAFATLGLAIAFCIAYYAPTPSTQRPDFERAMFVILPLAGTAIGWLIAYIAAPLDNNGHSRQSSVQSSNVQRQNVT